MGTGFLFLIRAARLGVTPDDLCERFNTNPDRVSAVWVALAEKKSISLTAT
jgi:hypothetical protein